MLNVLSIQSDVLGNSVYCNSLRRYFATFEDIDLTSCWYRDQQPASSKLVNKLARVGVPFAGNRDYRRARAEWGYGYVAGRLARRKLAERHYDLLHFHTQVQAFGSVALMSRTPTVISMDMTAYQIAREGGGRHHATHQPSIAMEHKVLHAAAHVVAFSEWARRSVLEEHGLPEDKVTAILPGTRLDAFAPPLFDRHQKPRILFVGGDFPRKGGWDLLAVFAEELADVAELHLVTSFPIATPLPRNVVVHPGISVYSEPWHTLFRNADLFVMPSYAEALGHVFQEAAGYGLALIGSNVGGIPEMVLDGENGYVIEPGDRNALSRRLTSLIENPETLLRFRRRSLEIARQHFDASRNFRKMADLFQRVAGVAAPPSEENRTARLFSL